MTEELQQIYNKSIEKPLQVLSVFNEFFGEDRVDMQGIPELSSIPKLYLGGQEQLNSYMVSHTPDIFILVHFPRVKVTNEFDKYTYVNHLYAKVSIDINGKLKYKFALNRAEYTVQHFTNNYMHSHVSSIPINNFEEFQTPCTGSGPINSTICSLIHGFDEDLWRLFCLELDKFVQVESVAGTPYHKLEQLTDRRSSLNKVRFKINYRGSLSRWDLSCITAIDLARFIKYIIDKNLIKFSYLNGNYRIAMSPNNFHIIISNAFIDWYNKEYNAGRMHFSLSDLLTAGNMLEEYKFINGQIWAVNRYYNGNLDYYHYTGRKICTFKGEDIVISFSDAVTQESTNESQCNIILLSASIIAYIATKILNVINFRYGNNTKDPNEKGVLFL